MASVGKVRSSSSVSTAGSVGRAGGVSAKDGADFASLLSSVSDAPAATGISPMNGIVSVDALLAAQFVDEADLSNQRKKRAIQHGNDILDRLDELRMAILTGRISKQKLIELSNLLKNYQAEKLDDDLASLIEEIRLRAEVELAKLV